MRNTAALYEAVMGKLWENEQIRGKANARIEARMAGRRRVKAVRRSSNGYVQAVARRARHSGTSSPM
jgi:type IV secretion system T-DNA border endonuclease VirD2